MILVGIDLNLKLSTLKVQMCFFKVIAIFMFNTSLILVFLRITTYTHIFHRLYMKLIYNKPAPYWGHDIIVTHHVT
jgi:hypothetical protein